MPYVLHKKKGKKKKKKEESCYQFLKPEKLWLQEALREKVLNLIPDLSPHNHKQNSFFTRPVVPKRSCRQGNVYVFSISELYE